MEHEKHEGTCARKDKEFWNQETTEYLITRHIYHHCWYSNINSSMTRNLSLRFQTLLMLYIVFVDAISCKPLYLSSRSQFQHIKLTKWPRTYEHIRDGLPWRVLLCHSIFQFSPKSLNEDKQAVYPTERLMGRQKSIESASGQWFMEWFLISYQ